MSTVEADEAAERILVRCPNWLGDVVMATPGLRALRAARPAAHIVAQLPSGLEPLIEGSGWVDEVWPLASRGGGLGGWRRDVARIAAGRFELGIALPESVSSALLMRLGGVRRVIGYARDPLRRRLLHDEIEAPPEWGRRRLVSRERFVARVLEALDVPVPDLRTSLQVSPAERHRLSRALAATGGNTPAGGGASPVVLAPGAGYGESKCWSIESFAGLADRLAAKGHSIVLLGAPGEEARVEAVRAAMHSVPVVLAGVLDLGAVKALLAGARALVANDAGARHVAAAFGVPCVVFFGPTSVAKTADNLGAIETLESQHDCRPCYRRTCPIDHRCLTSIGVAQAEAAFDRALARDARVQGHALPGPSLGGLAGA